MTGDASASLIPGDLLRHLRAIINPDHPTRYLNAALCRIGPDGQAEQIAMGRRTPDEATARTMDPDRMRVRVASITKAATAYIACALALQGGLDLDASLAEALDLRTDRAPMPNVRHLLNHTSGLRDTGGYIAEPPLTVLDLLESARFGVTEPGAYFEYCNLNFVLLGAIIERVAGDRFDRVMKRIVLDPIGARGGPNWVGVNATDRADHLPLYQRHGTEWVLEADGDGAAWEATLIWRGGRGLSLADYRPGLDTGLMSPHAGLRLTVGEAARLARLIGSDTPAAQLLRRETWRFDGSNGSWCDGLFPAYGHGITLIQGDDRIPGRLAGHAGHALGFSGGIWVNRATGVASAYVLTGSADLTDGSDQEAFFPPEEVAILRQF